LIFNPRPYIVVVVVIDVVVVVVPVSDVAMDFEIISTEECSESELSGSSRQEMYMKLEQDLLLQIKMCQANRIYFKSTGDVASMNKFQQVRISWSHRSRINNKLGKK
jgi:hypothetical protein